MEVITVHPLDPDIVRRYVVVLRGDQAVPEAWEAWWSPTLPGAIDEARRGNERAANRLTHGLAQALAGQWPSYFQQGFGFTTWEARIDRGVGMLLRPPSRLFVEAGLPEPVARAMPIRLDLQQGMMGGAWIPARLVPDLERQLDARLERTAKRLHDGEFDPYAMLGPMLEAATYARTQGLGLFEAMDVIGPGGEAVAGGVVVTPDRTRLAPAVQERIAEAIRPPKQAGLLARMFGRKGHEGFSPNGKTPPVSDVTPFEPE
ncbi:MAG: hypothetical protein ACTHMX_01840 [Thermomicrobiales bacterium]